jgi:hypothetical protein
MTEREKTRSSNEPIIPGQSLYLQAKNWLEKTGESPPAKMFGFFNCTHGIQLAAIALGLSDGRKVPSLSSLRFELSLGHRWLIGRKRIEMLLEAEFRNGRSQTLILTVTSDGNCQHRITQRDLTFGPYGFIEEDEKKTVRPKTKSTPKEIESSLVVLSEIRRLTAQSDSRKSS